MKNKKMALIGLGMFVLGASVYFGAFSGRNEKNWQELAVKAAPIKILIPATGTVEPKTHITVMAPVNGRIEEVKIAEGDNVRQGQIVAWMSSADRAALLDMAKAQGSKAVDRWSKEFRPTPIVSPVDGVVIKSNIVPGATVTNQTTLLELSDRLIVRAEVDETDIAKIKVGQGVDVNVDALPELSIRGTVVHIAHQSKSSNNVTIYEVEIQPERTIDTVRSGMTASVNFIIEEKPNAKVLPSWIASGYEEAVIDLFVRNDSGKAEKRRVKVGKSNGDYIEIIEGLTLQDIVMYLPVHFVTTSKSPLGIFNKKEQ